MAWVEHWNSQVGAPKGAPDLGDWPGPWRVISEGRRFGMHTVVKIVSLYLYWENVGDFDAETAHAGCLDKEVTTVVAGNL